MRCTHFQIHFAMIATRERTNRSAPCKFYKFAAKDLLCHSRISPTGKSAKHAFSNIYNSTKVQSGKHFQCVGTEIEFPCRHRALWKIANSDSNRQRRPNTMKYSAARRFTALNIDQMRNIICFNTCTMQYQIYYFARGPKLKFKILKISCHLHIDERYRMIQNA